MNVLAIIPESFNMQGPFVLAIDQGTSSTKTMIFDSGGKAVARGIEPLQTMYLEDGFVEQDPEVIYENVLLSVSKCLDNFKSAGGKVEEIRSCGISNQRETFVIWDENGKPFYNAVVWQCKRSTEICERLKSEGLSEVVSKKTGLLIDPYFSGTKVIWLNENDPETKEAILSGKACFGTVDTWLLYKLTDGRTYLTDHTNASRTLFFNLATLSWDHELIEEFGLTGLRLPDIRPSSSYFGSTHFNGLLKEALDITAMIGDSHAAAFGEGCFAKGLAKATMGTGCSILMNIGNQPKESGHGMVTTIGWSSETHVEYALEGVIVTCGATIEWLKNNLGLFSDSKQTEEMAASVQDSGGVYLVPAFSGLGAPHWDMGRKASVTGLTFNSDKNHIVRAALESVPYQIKDVITAMESDADIHLQELMIDGGLTSNHFVVQFLSDLLEKPVVNLGLPEVSALGAAYLSGLKSGVYQDITQLKNLNKDQTKVSPGKNAAQAKKGYAGWQEAIGAKKIWALLVIFCLFTLKPVFSQNKIERWERFELTLPGPQTGNPFADIQIGAEFSKGKEKTKIAGFYDGDGSYKVRFMPSDTGIWQFKTFSNHKSLNGKAGNFTCVVATGNNHGPVKVADTYHFKYADGKRYYPFGTTLYAWTHQPAGLEEITLQTLSKAPFNKVRMCVFPKYYSHVENEPLFYPYVKKGESTGPDGKRKFAWDFTRFDPAFFQHLEKRIDDLKNLGIEVDIIIFHPYDRGHWGFDSLGRENDLKYIQYLTARLSSFRNVWWSMANEFDYITTKPREIWDVYTKAVVQADPYQHLCSIHNGSVYYDNWKPEFTHVSIQNGSVVEDFGRAILLRDVFFRPMVYDEVCYEGDLQQRWGHLSGEEMTQAFWQGIIAGTYVTHGETFKNAGDTIFWAKGGKLTGSSPARIGFLKKILEEAPGPLELSDPWKDHKTARSDSSYYLIYFGKEMSPEWTLNLPRKGGPKAGKKFSIELIDTWNMTVQKLPEIFEAAESTDYRIFDKSRKSIRLPVKPYLALRLIELGGS